MTDNVALSIDRRSLIAGAVVAAASLNTPPLLAESQVAAPLGSKRFPKGFYWGCATAAHQVEGNNTNSDLWFLENIQPTTFVERSGDCCDSYHRYEEDIALLARLGFNSYRFSVEWARIEPTKGYFSNAELDYYERLAATCRRHGIAPVMTFFHVSAPRWFSAQGGWFNPDAPQLFARFCDKVMRAFGDQIEIACTINEPQLNEVFRSIPGASAYFTKADAAGLAMCEAAARALDVPEFQTISGHPDFARARPNLIAAHEQAVAAIKAVRGNLPVGVTLSVTDFQPGNEGSPYLEVRQRAYGEWIEAIKRADDFTGVQCYRQVRIPGSGQLVPPAPPMPFVKPGDMNGSLARPEAVANTLEYIHEATGKPVIMTENGLETENDAHRVWYIGEAIRSLHSAIAKGIPVHGYFHWSLVDNFEWARGYKPKYGLVAVDRETFQRTPKPSASVLGTIARHNAV